jgi:hypothetical protein
MNTTSNHRGRLSATVLVAIGTCLLASACHATASAATHPVPTPPSTSIAATAPGTPDTTAPDTATPDATATAGAAVAGGCLISPQEASTAFGHDAGPGSGNANTCTYQTAGGIMTIFGTSYGDNAMTAFATQREAGKALPGFQDIDGVGEHAFANLDDPMSLIEFVKGSTVVVIQLGISPMPTVQVLTTLGQAASGRV